MCIRDSPRAVGDGVGRLYARIAGRIVAYDVDAVQDAVQDVATAAERSVQALAVLGRADLGGVGGGDGSDGVGVVDGPEHVVDGTVVAAELPNRRLDMRQAEDVAEQHVGELALEGDVVDGEDALDVLVDGQALIELAQEHRRERGVPVVAVEDVARKAVGKVLQALANRLGEVGEALPVVEEAVRVAATEVALVVDEDVGDPVVDEALEPAVLVAPAEGYVELPDVLHLGLVLIGDRGVLRDHDDDVGPGGVEGGGQRAGDVAESAGLHEGRRLCACLLYTSRCV